MCVCVFGTRLEPAHICQESTLSTELHSQTKNGILKVSTSVNPVTQEPLYRVRSLERSPEGLGVGSSERVSPLLRPRQGLQIFNYLVVWSGFRQEGKESLQKSLTEMKI